MRDQSCQCCGQVFPMGQTFMVYNTVMCEACGNQALAQRPGKRKPGDVFDNSIQPSASNATPTAARGVSSRGRHACLRRLRVYASTPTLSALDQGQLCRTVGAGGAFVLVQLAIFRWIRGGTSGLSGCGRRKSVEAARLMSSAAQHVPSRPSWATWPIFSTACNCWRRPVERGGALLQRCVSRLPQGSDIRGAAQRCLIDAEARTAFDKRNYDAFLERERRRYVGGRTTRQRSRESLPHMPANMPSAGIPFQKQQAMHYLDLAAEKDKSPENAEHRQRMLYRLHSRNHREGRV